MAQNQNNKQSPKTQKNTQKRTNKGAESPVVDLASAAASIDKESLGQSTRVYALAKRMGVTSKVLINALDEIGVKKVAQSSIEKDEVVRLLDSLNQGQGTQAEPAELAEPAESTEPAEQAAPQERKRTRKSTRKTTTKKATSPQEPVQKEAAQQEPAQQEPAQQDQAPTEEAQQEEAPAASTEEETKGAAQSKPARKRTRKATRKTTTKAPEPAPAPEAEPAEPELVDQESTEPESAEVLDDSSASDDAGSAEQQGGNDKLRERVRKNVDNEIHQIAEKVEADLAAAAEEVVDEEPLEDITPEITPAPPVAPNAATAAYAPLFVAPGADDTDDLEMEDLPDTDSDNDQSSESRAGSRRGRRRSSAHREPREQETPQSEQRDSRDTREADAQPSISVEHNDEPVAIKGSTRLEAQRRRRTEMREAGKQKKHIVSQAEFLARRESVERTMVVRERDRHDGPGTLTQVGVLEDELLVEHFVTSEAQASMIGNIYLGRVQNVLPAMEAVFIDIGTGRNGVLYSSDVDWKAAGLGGRGRRIEQALKSGDQVLVQVSKDPLGHKGPRLTTQISLAGRFLVYVPGGRSAGISRKLPGPERKRLKDILGRVIPGKGGAIIRTAAENVPEEAIGADVNRLHNVWEDIQERAEDEKKSKGAKPVTLYEEPDMLVKVVRDLFNEDFTSLVIDGKRAWNIVHSYVKSVAPDLVDRLVRYRSEEHDGKDAFEQYRIEEQIQKALGRKVWLPSGGSLVIDRTEAMVVVDVNTGKFTGAGGNLEETVTRNNLEAAEEIVRQMRLRDLGGMIVVDFIDMVLPENQDLVLRRLKEALGRDRTRHQVSEVTSLGLVQMTRKRLGTGLLETFSTECEHCGGRGIILHDDPVDEQEHDNTHREHSTSHRRRDDHKHEPKQQDRDKDAPAPKQPSSRDNFDDLEKIAASVVRVDDDDSDASDQQHGDEEQRTERRASSRRRGRRGGNRGRGGRAHDDEQSTTQHHEEAAAPSTSDSTSDLDRIVSEALDTARESDPDEPSDADYVSSHAADDSEDLGADEKSFDQAVKEFDSSPRRRRNTRGNSRSDRRPKREDFQTEQPKRAAQHTEVAEPQKQQEQQQPKQAEAQQQAEAKQPQPKQQPPTTRTRGRRRAVRRTMSGAQDAAVDKQAKQQQPQQQPAKQAEPAAAPDAGRPSRGRRRATRRSTSRK